MCVTYVNFYMYNNPDALMEGKKARKLNDKKKNLYTLGQSIFKEG